MAHKRKKIAAKKKVAKKKRGRPKGSKNVVKAKTVKFSKKDSAVVRMIQVSGTTVSRGTVAFVIPAKKDVRIMQDGNVVVLSFETISEINSQCK